MNSEIIMARAKGYTNMVALGLSNISVNEKTGVVTFELNDGSSAAYTFPTPSNGKDGVSITSVEVDENNKVMVSYSDGTTAPAGVIKTIKGDKGDSNIFIGTMDEYKTTSSNGKIANGSLVVITSEK